MKIQMHVWGWIVIGLLSCASWLSAQELKRFSMNLDNQPLPVALKQIGQAGGKHVIFSYNETEQYKVSAVIRQKSEAEALRIVLTGTPFVSKERPEYFVIQKEEAQRPTFEIRGEVVDERNEPLAYANVLLLTESDSAFVTGAVTREDGSFRISAEKGFPYLLKVTYIGYQTAYAEETTANRIRLLPDAHQVKEVVVSADRPQVVSKENGLLANVAGTPLAKMGSAAEMISHLPFVVRNQGSYTVLGHGSPTIYINNRKVRDVAELDRIRAEEIVSAEVITTPGVEYGVDVPAVIKIRTIRMRGQGLSGRFNASYSQGHGEYGSEYAALNYRTGGLDLFVKGYLSERNGWCDNSVSQRMNVSSLWQTEQKLLTKSPGQVRFSGEVGFNYELNEHHSLGVRYTPESPVGELKTESVGEMVAWRDGVEIDRINTEHYSRQTPIMKQALDGYYAGQFGEWVVDLNVDYLYSRSQSFEQVVDNGETSAESENRIRNYLYAAKLVARRNLPLGTLSFGTEETFTNRHDRFLQSGFSSDANDHITQTIYSLFADYAMQWRGLRLSAGLRYERQKTDYYEDNIYQPEQSPVYNDLIPVLSLGYRWKGWNWGVSYRLMKINPGYRMLSSNVSYVSKYMYQSGNPLIRSQKHHRFSLNGAKDWFFFSVFLDRVFEMYTSYMKPYNEETHPGVMLMTNDVIPTTWTYGANIGISPKWGCWHPQLNAGVDFYDADVLSLGITEHKNEPRFQFKLDNSFVLPKGWFLNLNGNVMLRAQQSYCVFHSTGSVNLRVSKSFLKEEALNVALTASDLFFTGDRDWGIYGDRTYNRMTSNADSRQVGIQISYKFNATKSKYKGTGAGQSEKGRL